MDVFISWSGGPSKLVATALRDGFATTIQAASPFMSSTSIRSGARWFTEIGEKLNESNYGIICLTPDNLESTWIHFEAGSLAKNVATSRVCCYLVGVPHSNVLQPRSQFQNRVADRDDTWKLLVDVNKALPESQRVEEQGLKKLYDNLFWPEVDKSIAAAKIEMGKSRQPAPRSDASKLDEMLYLLRTIAFAMQQDNNYPKTIATAQRPVLHHLEQSGRIDELKQIVQQMDTPALLRVAAEINCGPLCDAICETLAQRERWDDTQVCQSIEGTRKQVFG